MHLNHHQNHMTLEYTFTAFSFKGESSKFTIPDSRPLDDLNLIIVLGNYKYSSERLVHDASDHFVREIVDIFLFLTLGVILFLNIYFVILVVIMI